MAVKTNCVVHGKPMYRVRAKIGQRLDGTYIYKNFYGAGKLEAERKRNEYFTKKEKSDQFPTLGHAARYYCYEVMPHESIAHGTYELYERQYRVRLSDAEFMGKPIDEVTSRDIQSFLNFLAKIKVAPSAISAAHKFLRKLYSYLSAEGYRDITATISVPRRKNDRQNGDINVFNPQEVSDIIQTPNPLHVLFVLALATGLRLGEILALTVDDIRDGSVLVDKQVVEFYRPDGHGMMEFVREVTPPKSARSVRTVPIPDSARKDIEEWIKDMRSGLLFSTASGGYIDRSNFRRAWKRHLRRAGVDYKKFHSCRATYGTMLAQSGVPLEVASKLLGHSDVTITAKYYRSISKKEMVSAVDKINHLF